MTPKRGNIGFFQGFTHGDILSGIGGPVVPSVQQNVLWDDLYYIRNDITICD